jgi:hypothetical protein
MKTTANNNSENNNKVMKLNMFHTGLRNGRYTVEITEEEWNDHGINHSGYYKVNKECEGVAGILCHVWLDEKMIARINEFFAK